MKKTLFGLAVVALAVSSCSQNEEVSSDLTKKRAINFTAYTQLAPTRTVETTTTNLTTFKAVATRFGAETQVFYQATDYTKDEANGYWKSSPEYLWPNYNLNFYAYNGFPSGKGTCTDGIASTTSTPRTLTITPATDLADQTDLIAGTKFNAGPVDKTPITFNHILSRVSIQAKSSNSNYVVKVLQAKLANLAGNGTFTYATPNAAATPYTDNSCASGFYAGVTKYDVNKKNVDASVDYLTKSGSVVLTDSYQRVMFDGVTDPTTTTQLDWYLIPQEFKAWPVNPSTAGTNPYYMQAATEAGAKNNTYVALLVTITTNKGAKVYPIGESATSAWMAVPLTVQDYQVPANETTGAAVASGAKTNGFSQGKNYIIKLNFFSAENGGSGSSDPETGEEPKGKPIINPTNKYIRFTPTVTAFEDGATIEYNL